MLVPVRRVLAAACLALAAPSFAAPGAAVATAPAATTQVFQPTIGAPLRYRSVRETHVIRNGQQSLREKVTSTEELEFVERNADGFALRWTSRSAAVEAQAPMKAIMERAIAPALDKPMLIQTNANGTPTAILNLAEMRKLYLASIDELTAGLDQTTAGLPAEARAMLGKMFGDMARTYRDLDDAALTQMLLEEPQFYFGYGGATLAPGQAIPIEARMSLPLVGTEADVIGKVELRSREPGGAGTFVVSTATSPESVRRALAAFSDKMFASVPAAQRQAMSEQIRKLQDLSVTDELVLTLGADGLPQRASYRKRAGTAADGQLEIRSFELLP